MNSTTKITVMVPSGDKCTGCDFLIKSYYENANRAATEATTCSIFKTTIEYDKKCVGCRNCSRGFI